MGAGLPIGQGRPLGGAAAQDMEASKLGRYAIQNRDAISYDEMQEIILHFSAYSGMPRATVLRDVASQWQASQP